MGSIIPVKGNSTMTTLYKVPNLSILDFHKHGGCLWDVIRPGCPKHTKHWKVSTPPPPATWDWHCVGGGFPKHAAQTACTRADSSGTSLSTGGSDVWRRLPSGRCGSLPIRSSPLWLYHTPNFSSQPRAEATH